MSKTPFKKTLLASTIFLLAIAQAHSAVVRDDVPYEYFRDLAENKGQFKAGETKGFVIYDIHGNKLGTILAGIEMPNFDFADRKIAISALVHPQYMMSVAHNQDTHFGGISDIYKKLLNLYTGKHWSTPEFGGQGYNPDAHHFNYHLVDRNDQETYFAVKKNEDDYNVPRLIKMVTEIANPISITDAGETSDIYLDKTRFPVFLRVGGGTQFIRNDNEAMPKSIPLSSGYMYLIGGIPLERVKHPTKDTLLEFKGKVNDTPMSAYWTKGDSGSPIIAYDTHKNRWVLIGSSGYYFGDDNNKNGTVIVKNNFFEIKKAEDFGGVINNQIKNNIYRWSIQKEANNETKYSTIVSDNNSTTMTLDIKHDNNDTKEWDKENGHIQSLQTMINNHQNAERFLSVVQDFKLLQNNNSRNNEENQKFENLKIQIDEIGKQYKVENPQGNISQLESDLTIMKNNAPTVIRETIAKLRQYFNHGKDLHIEGKQGTLELQENINQGAGSLYFKTDFTVKGKHQDNTWLGGGIDIAKDNTVTWQIKNPENDRLSKLGAGTLLVNGIGDNKGDISVGDGTVILNQQDGKAFNQVGIVSGRPTVKLMDSHQIDPNQLYFGYRGGRLDVNGNNLTFKYIQNVDDGAMIVNHNNNQPAEINISGLEQLDSNLGFSYRIINNHAYVLRGNAFEPTSQGQDSLDWVYLGGVGDEFKTERREKYYQYINHNKRVTAFNGIFGETDKQKVNGKLNITYDPSSQANAENYSWLLSGGSNLNGDLTVKSGSVLLSGRPTPHALDIKMQVSSNNDKQYFELKSKQEVIKEDDWINRSFTANNFNVVNDAKLYVTRNVESFNGNINAKDKAFIQLGFNNGTTPVCIRSDYHGETSCNPTENYADAKVLDSIPIIQATSNLNLKGNSEFHLGKAKLTGNVSAELPTKMNLLKDAHWVMTSDSTVGNLNLTDGSQITLNSAKDAQSVSKYNILNVLGNLSGKGQFNYFTNLFEILGDKVTVQGTARGDYVFNVQNTGAEPKGSLTLLSASDNQATARLSNLKGVDLGAYRYQLIKTENEYRLYNPIINEPLVTMKGSSVKAEPLQPYTGEISIKGSSVKAEPLQPYTGEISIKGSSVKAEPLQPYTGEISIKGSSVKAEPLQPYTGEISIKGSSVKAEPLQPYTGEISIKGSSVKAEPLQPYTGEISIKGSSVKAEPLQPYTGEISIKGSSVKAEPLQPYTGEISIKGSSVKAEPLSSLNQAKLEEEIKQIKNIKQEIARAILAKNQAIEATTVAKQSLKTSNAKNKLTEAESLAKTAKLSANTVKELAKSLVEQAITENAKSVAEAVMQQATTIEEQSIEALDLITTLQFNNVQTQAEVISSYTNTALSELSSQVNSLNHISNSLNRYLLSDNQVNHSVPAGSSVTHYLLTGGNNNSRVWLNTDYYKETAHQSDNYRQYKKTETLTQMGTDTLFNTQRGQLLLGGAWSHSSVNNTFDDNMTGETDINMLSLYTKLILKDNAFLTLDTGYGHAKNNIQYQGDNVEFKRDLTTIGFNLGKTFNMTKIDIQPSIGIRYHHLSDVNYTLGGAQVSIDDVDAVNYRVGIALAKNINLANGLSIKPSIATNYIDSNQKNADVLMNNNYSFKQEFGRYTYHEAGLAIGKKLWEASLNFSHAEGNEINKQQSIGLKFNYLW